MSKNKNSKKKKHQPRWLLGIIFLLILAGLACNVPFMASGESQEKPRGFVETSVAQTMAAIAGVPADDSDDQSGDTEEPAPPTLTFTPEFTYTPSHTPTETSTPTPNVAMIYASGDTNCREGQGSDFAWLASLQTGDEAEVVGIDNTGEYPYWYIRRPDQPNSFCWLWGKYATPSGPYQSLPVFTPMPTPTPGMQFSITYQSLETCLGYWGLLYHIENTGAVTLESFRVTANDHTGGSNPQDAERDTFVQYSGCATVASQNDLESGEGQHIVMVFNNNPTGHDITTKFKICSEDALGGECVTRTYRHTP
jgi:hypothetical protein